MSQIDVLPELKQILGAMIFGANRPLPAKKMRECLIEVAKAHGAETAAFAEVKPADIERALESLREDLEKAKLGFHLGEVAGGYRLQSDVACGRWLKQLLEMGNPNRLSRPALETLSIIAYRQPISRADIEGIRGVVVDHVIRALMELHLIKIVGRSELPGRPFLYGTTQTFLEHFGLKDIKELGEVDPLLMRKAQAAKAAKPAAEAAPAAADAAAKPATARDEMAGLLEASETPEGEAVFAEPEPPKGRKSKAKKAAEVTPAPVEAVVEKPATDPVEEAPEEEEFEDEDDDEFEDDEDEDGEGDADDAGEDGDDRE